MVLQNKVCRIILVAATIANIVNRQSVPLVDTTKTVNKKFSPAISSYKADLTGLVTYVKSMVDYAASIVPQDQQSYTPIFIRVCSSII
jgi:Golgi nucleoside diphosphatase